jgi:hypothetical protein
VTNNDGGVRVRSPLCESRKSERRDFEVQPTRGWFEVAGGKRNELSARQHHSVADRQAATHEDGRVLIVIGQEMTPSRIELCGGQAEFSVHQRTS